MEGRVALKYKGMKGVLMLKMPRNNRHGQVNENTEVFSAPLRNFLFKEKRKKEKTSRNLSSSVLASLEKNCSDMSEKSI